MKEQVSALAAALCTPYDRALLRGGGLKGQPRVVSPPPTYLVVPLRKPKISWVFVLFQRISRDLSTGLSTIASADALLH
jgi:hypothetical protein